jgi:3-oxoacyl-[acyl-carrier protein] reductase
MAAVAPASEISMGFTFHQATSEGPTATPEATGAAPTSPLRQDQKVILVTGASGGIGREIVSGLAKDCSVLAMVNRTPLSTDLKNLPNVAEVRADLSAPGWPEEIQTAFPDGCLYGIVHAAWPGASRGGLLHTRDDVIEQQVAFGTLHTIRLARLLFDCAPAEGGRFVALGSAYGSRQPAISLAAYSLGKAALENTVTLLAPELARKQITINTVCPSFVPAGMNQSVSETRRRKEESQVPMGRLCLPEDVVGIVQFLLSSSASFVSGQDIQLSGAQL